MGNGEWGIERHGGGLIASSHLTKAAGKSPLVTEADFIEA